MHHQSTKQTIAIMGMIGALLLVPLFPAHAQPPTPPGPPREPGYQIDQSPLPLLPGAQPEDRSGDTANAVPACAPWSKLTYAAYHGSSWDVYVANGDGSGQTQLTDRDKPDTAPKFDRGCTRIVYQSLRGDEYQIYIMNADGSGPIGLTTSANNGVPGWSPPAGGTRIAFESDRDGNGEVYVMNADGSGQTRLTVNLAYDGMPAWSPDGTHIAFVSNRTGLYEVWVMNADGTGQTPVTSGVPYAQYPCWSPDGTQIAFSNDDNGDGFMDIDVVNASGGAVTFVAGHTNSVDYWYPAWSPDSEWIAYGRTELIYYNGNWYWTRSDIYASGAPGYVHTQTTLVASGRDWRPHWGTLDTQAPTSNMTALPAQSPGPFTASWSGSDVGPAGMGSYDVQVKDGVAGAWTDWQLGTTATSATYPGVGGHAYYLRVRARDRAGNLAPWPTSYQATTTVETLPPTAIIQPLPAYSRDSVSVGWYGFDSGGSGIKTYDVQVRDGVSGDWTDWQMGISTTLASFSGTAGHAYYFRTRATDRAQSTGNWSSVADTHTTFLLLTD
ncbi:MAG: hypothetical protein KKB13_26825, partial [Chloroflexi bacterium]|nr:hypothetical protein [Chloroflexota bacterium]